MNPEDLGLSVEELQDLVLLHGFVCVSLPGLLSISSNHGWGESCWRSLVSAVGDRIANLVIECQENGGRQTGWVPLEIPDVHLLRCAIENSDGQELVVFYK